MLEKIKKHEGLITHLVCTLFIALDIVIFIIGTINKESNLVSHYGRFMFVTLSSYLLLSFKLPKLIKDKEKTVSTKWIIFGIEVLIVIMLTIFFNTILRMLLILVGLAFLIIGLFYLVNKDYLHNLDSHLAVVIIVGLLYSLSGIALMVLSFSLRDDYAFFCFFSFLSLAIPVIIIINNVYHLTFLAAFKRRPEANNKIDQNAIEVTYKEKDDKKNK
ncbi:MAG: hypothetical protein HUJ61_03330 [Bacilli bacterium]|nr:hypothetical protein [Bacilli bacterium]